MTCIIVCGVWRVVCSRTRLRTRAPVSVSEGGSRMSPMLARLHYIFNVLSLLGAFTSQTLIMLIKTQMCIRDRLYRATLVNVEGLCNTTYTHKCTRARMCVCYPVKLYNYSELVLYFHVSHLSCRPILRNMKIEHYNLRIDLISCL